MKTIYKYQLQTVDEQSIPMPYGAEVLCVQVQFNNPVLYAIIDTEEKTKIYKSFIISGTGHELPSLSDKKYIGTYQLFNGNLVFHVFEVI